MIVKKTALDGLLIIEPKVFRDERGEFMEVWHHEQYKAAGIESAFIQDNLSLSRKGVLRGMHFQNPGGQGKLVSVLAGEVFDVAVDLRVDSPTFKQWVGVTLSGENRTQLFIPPGFGHGFLVTGEDAVFLYKATAFYKPEYEYTIRWDDPEIGIKWPGPIRLMSDKDKHGPLLKDFGEDRLPRIRT